MVPKVCIIAISFEGAEAEAHKNKVLALLQLTQSLMQPCIQNLVISLLPWYPADDKRSDPIA